MKLDQMPRLFPSGFYVVMGDFPRRLPPQQLFKFAVLFCITHLIPPLFLIWLTYNGVAKTADSKPAKALVQQVEDLAVKED